MSFYNQIVSFLAVAEEQNFTRAGEKLALTTTAVSKQIKLLEKKLGAQLFTRDTRTVRITEIGERFYLHAKRIAKEIATAEDFVLMQQEVPQGKLRIFCSFVFAELFLIKSLVEFQKRYPLVELEVEMGDYIPDPNKEFYDIIIGFSLEAGIAPNLHYRKLFTNHYVLCASAGYLKEHGEPKTVKELKGHRIINHPLRQPVNTITFTDGTQIYFENLPILINSVTALLQFCKDGAGIFQVSELQANKMLKTGEILQILPQEKFAEINICLFFRPAEYEQKKVRCFIDFYVAKTATI